MSGGRGECVEIAFAKYCLTEKRIFYYEYSPDLGALLGSFTSCFIWVCDGFGSGSSQCGVYRLGRSEASLGLFWRCLGEDAVYRSLGLPGHGFCEQPLPAGSMRPDSGEFADGIVAGSYARLGLEYEDAGSESPAGRLLQTSLNVLIGVPFYG